MASGSNFTSTNDDTPASSSRAPPNGRAPIDNQDDQMTTLFDGTDDDPLRDDPLNDDDDDDSQLPGPISFKRKQKQSILSKSRFLSRITGNRLEGSHSRHSSQSGTGTPTGLHPLNTSVGGANPLTHTSSNPKENEPLDWYVDGPGRRVGYEDLTAIDWIFEYTKERRRLRVLYSSATGILGYFNILLDSSQIWFILILTGIAVGAVAAGIDVASDWLGDIKGGFCSSGVDSGAFYLNKSFCCLGYDQGEKCLGWIPWAAALGISSRGGKWFIEYFFFLLLSVSSLTTSSM